MTAVFSPPGASPWARFDDLTMSGQAFAFTAPVGEVVAREPSQVAGAISAVEAAARQGLWAAGFVSYEAAPGLDRALRVGQAGFDQPPLVWFGLFEQRGACPVIAAEPSGGTRPAWLFAGDPGRYHRRFERVRGHIEAGETYQLNLTDRWTAVVADAPALYRQMVLAQRPGYAGYVDTGRHLVASASPELFFDWRDGRLTSRPMKGTAARGRWTDEDRAAATGLSASAKDRAENVMIVDLVRNDIGRVAEYGSVEVTDLFGLERYPTVWQLASTVTGLTRPGTSLLDIFRALFPCGSVTGAPKCRTMDLIAEIESDRRGVYCGAVGYVGPARAGIQARFNVAIRTAVVDRATGAAIYGSGGGIVWDSEADRELAELHTKAGILAAPAGPFGLIETMAFIPRRGLRHCHQHLDRMAGSADYFGMPFHRADAVARLDSATESLDSPARVRLSLARSGDLDVTTGPLPVAVGPVRLVVDDRPVRSSDVRLFHKTSDRARYEDRRARHRDADDVVLINERGQVTETTIANVAARIDGTWCTPPLEAGCLPGVARACALARGVLVERPITVAELRSAGAVAVLSSLRGWCEAVVR